MSSVEVSNVDARSTVVVAAATTWPEFPRVWKSLLDEVWECLHGNGIESGCPNVMLYLDNVPNVQVGVLCDADITVRGRVARSQLPAGRIATARHSGSYADLGSTHDAIQKYCATERLELAGPRWEIYGPNDPVNPWVDINYLLL